MSIEKKTYFNESRKSLKQQLLFKVSLFKFYFVSAFLYLNFYNEHFVKQIASLCLQLAIKSAIF